MNLRIAGIAGAALLAAGAALGGGAPGDAAAAARADDAGARPAAGDGRGGVRLRRIGRFDNPTYVHGPRGAGGLLFVVEQRGVIRLVKGSRKLGGKFLDISNRVSSGGEQGLLSVAFAPDYRSSRRFYVYFTDRSGDVRVQEYRRSPNRPRKARRSSARDILRIPQPFSNHNGGQLQFGPDGRLYIGVGDGGGAGDPRGNAQQGSSLLGKLLRINPLRRGRNRPYRIPRDNPFVGRSDRRSEIYSLGLRNPWRFSFDRRRIAIADVGQDRFEEVNYVRLADAAGANFGWNAFEGRRRFPGGGPPPNEHTGPIHVYGHGGGNCSITGGYVVRDRGLRSLRGRYLYADLCAGRLRSFVPRVGGARGDRSLGLRRPEISSFGEDRRGRIYVASLAGGVFRLVPR